MIRAIWRLLRENIVIVLAFLGVATGWYVGYQLTQVVVTVRAQQEAIAKTAEVLQEQLPTLVQAPENVQASENVQGQLSTTLVGALRALLTDDGVRITFDAGGIHLAFRNDTSGEEAAVIPIQVELPARVEAIGPCMVALYQHFQVHERGEPVVPPPACESF